MAKVIVELPADRYEQLQRRAQAAGKSPEALSGEILEVALGAGATLGAAEDATRPAARAADETNAPPGGVSDAASPPPPRSAREILRDAGHLVELSPEMHKLIIPGVTLEEVQEALTRAGGPSLSDIIIEQRGPKV